MRHRAPHPQRKMSAGGCSISLLTILVIHLYTWAEQAVSILMPTNIQVNMNSNVNPSLVRPVLGHVLAIERSLSLRLEQLTSWLQSGHQAVHSQTPPPPPPPRSGGSDGVCETTQEYASDTEYATLLSSSLTALYYTWAWGPAGFCSVPHTPPILGQCRGIGCVRNIHDTAEKTPV